MTDLQECELRLLEIALRVIEENKFNYFLVCGSALGAAKYRGFIPWDDDIDIALPRKDYEKFIKIFNQYCFENVELQNYRFDSSVPFFYSKLRDCKTTYIEKTVVNIDMNHGIFIDIFPLDGYPANRIEALGFEIKKKCIWRLISSVFKREQRWKNIILYPLRYIVQKNLNKIISRYENLISKYHIEGSDFICNYGNSHLAIEYAPRWQYGIGMDAEFEGLQVRIPENYDAYLTQKYGDWRADLPENERIGHHYYTICDCNKSYKEYLNKMRV